jgi:hypothetical protein
MIFFLRTINTLYPQKKKLQKYFFVLIFFILLSRRINTKIVKEKKYVMKNWKYKTRGRTIMKTSSEISLLNLLNHLFTSTEEREGYVSTFSVDDLFLLVNTGSSRVHTHTHTHTHTHRNQVVTYFLYTHLEVIVTLYIGQKIRLFFCENFVNVKSYFCNFAECCAISKKHFLALRNAAQSPKTIFQLCATSRNLQKAFFNFAQCRAIFKNYFSILRNVAHYSSFIFLTL